MAAIVAQIQFAPARGVAGRGEGYCASTMTRGERGQRGA